MAFTNANGGPDTVGATSVKLTANGKSSVTFYIEAEDLKATLAKVERLGGKTVMPPMKAGPVELAMFADPEGNVIGLAKGM